MTENPPEHDKYNCDECRANMTDGFLTPTNTPLPDNKNQPPMEKETPEENLNQACVRVLKEMTRETPYEKLKRETDELETDKLNRIDKGMYEASGGTPTEEWEENVDEWVDSKNWEAVFPPHTRETVRTELKTLFRSLITSHDAELRRKIEGTLLTILVRSGDRKTLDEYIRRDAVLALLGKKNV